MYICVCIYICTRGSCIWPIAPQQLLFEKLHLRCGQDTLVQELARTVQLVHYLARCAATLRWWHCRCWCRCKRWRQGCCRSWSAGGPDPFHIDTSAAMPARICLHPVDSIDVRVLQLHAPSGHYYAGLQ